ncbi:MAG: sugar ABC transporter ATP-binding protein [Hyphomicrobiales bacterium]
MLDLIEISKIYTGVVALDRVSLRIGRGEVLGLIGENGAGKSTLMKILGGVTAPSAGTIKLDDIPREALSVNEAIAGGIAFVHQELNLFDNLDVAANVLIGREPLKGGPLRLIDRKALNQRVRPLLAKLGADFGPETPVAELSLAQMQLVEIARALSLDARLVIMDEPTSSLTITETQRLMKVIQELRGSGVSVIFISHRLNEVEQCADRVVVLRDGRLAGELPREEITHDRMIRLMIGRDLKSLYVAPARPPAFHGLEISELRTTAFPERPVSVDVRSGEILGLAGLVGSGRTELARAVFGIDPKLAGAVALRGRRIDITAPRDAIRSGLYLVPEDRKRSGLVLDFSIAENISLPDLSSYSRCSLVEPTREKENADSQRKALGIRTADVRSPASSLSGGNQQKVVLAKWLSMRPNAIIFDEPTRGIDVGAKTEIYSLMRKLADQGVAVLMISSDMEEVVGVSDRIAVMCEGAISGFLDRPQFSEENVLRLAVGKTLN